MINWSKEKEKIITSAFSIILLGILTFTGAQFKNSLNKIKENEMSLVRIETSLGNIEEKLNNLGNSVSTLNGSVDAKLSILEMQVELTKKDVEYLRTER